MGYTQGMSDLLAPLLATFEDEVDSFWCFVGLMELSLFATTPKDDSMDKSLVSGCFLTIISDNFPDNFPDNNFFSPALFPPKALHYSRCVLMQCVTQGAAH